jgi:acyl carrier protein phosphodiesterase
VKRMDRIRERSEDKTMNKWLDTQDVCQMLNICPRTVQTLRDNNPDLKQAKEQFPTNENKVQVAVNEKGKTHEATKHTKDPLSPGQSAPKNEKQQKEQNAEEQKPKRKARSVKM